MCLMGKDDFVLLRKVGVGFSLAGDDKVGKLGIGFFVVGVRKKKN